MIITTRQCICDNCQKEIANYHDNECLNPKVESFYAVKGDDSREDFYHHYCSVECLTSGLKKAWDIYLDTHQNGIFIRKISI